MGKFVGRRTSQNTQYLSLQKGLTLVELIVDIALLSILLLFAIILVDPFKQIEKSKDAKRQSDVAELKRALDVYYNDHNCYPASIPYGQEWSEGGTVYMKVVPQDGECNSTKASCYVYQVNAMDACPQWNVLYSKKNSTPATTTDCPLQAFPDPCSPTNYNASWACALSGEVDCSYISTTAIELPISDAPTPTVTPTSPPPPTATPIPTGTPWPTFTPTPTPNCVKKYACTGGEPARCNVVQASVAVYCGFDGCFGGQCCNNDCL